MTRFSFLSSAVLLGLVACSPPPSDTAAPPTPSTVTVKTVKLEQKQISATITAFGSVSVLPKELEIISVQYESLVARLLVSAGEPVAPGAALIDITPSPDAQLQFDGAQSAADSAAEQLVNVQKRFDLKLAVNLELQQATQAARDAKARVESLQKRGEGKASTLIADETGIVDTIPVSIGQVVPAGTPLLTIVPRDNIEVRLGVEPENADSFDAGAKVKLFSVNRDDIQSEGTVRLVTKRINPLTRLIDTYVSVTPPSPLLLDSYVRGEIETAQKEGFVVPREAVLSNTSGDYVFTVQNGKAVRHSVTTGLETKTEALVTSDTLHPGDDVVTTGNAQLSDGMVLTTTPAATPTAAALAAPAQP